MTHCLERKFVRPTQISKHLNCSICTEVFLEPMRLSCAHTFCKKCIDLWTGSNNSCPVCRKGLEKKLLGKDLIAEKIIFDLEVYCVNKLCDWKDKLENLTKHVRNCPFAKAPEWLNEAQNITALGTEDTKVDMFLEADDQYIERVNEEIPRKSFLERLYTKSFESQQLVDSVFNTKPQPQEEPEEKPSKKKGRGKGKAKGKGRGKAKGKEEEKVQEPVVKGNSFAEYEDFLCTLGDSDDETKDEQTDPQTLETTSKESLNSKQDGIVQKIEIMNLSTKSSLEKEDSINDKTGSQSNSKSEPVEENNLDASMEYTPNRRGKRGATKTIASEPSKVKKTKTGSD